MVKINTYLEYRKSRRFEHKTTVMLENETNGYLSYGLMMNYRSGEMCNGSDAAYNKGAEIRIRFDKPLYKTAPTTYSGKVRWCKGLVRDNFDYSYGVGIKYD